jgi:hypothetical protein
MTTEQAAYFRTIPIWTAGYPANPDLYNYVPSFYIPNPLKFGPVWLWQYSDKAVAQGIDGAVDANWMSPEIITYLGATPPTVNDVEHNPYDGITYYTGVRNGWKFALFVIDTTKVNYEVTAPALLERVSTAQARTGATLAINGGEWSRETGKVADYSVSNGKIIKARVNTVPSFVVSNSGRREHFKP